jgi:hypothetical protein
MSDALYEVALVGNLGESLIVNRWNYVGSVNDVPSGDAFGLLSAMGLVPTAGVFPDGLMGDAIASLTSNGVEWNQAICRSIYDPTDFVDLPFVPIVPGLQSGDVEAAFVAIGFRSNRVRTDIHRGYKRFAGVNESLISSYGLLNSTAIGLATTLAGLLGEVLTFEESSLTDTFTPCIVHKEKIEDEPGHFVYRYYEDIADQLDNVATGITWENYPTVRSQISRQIGRGS